MATESPPPPSSTTISPPSASASSSPYPYAFAPDIIRAHQKDAYFQGVLTNQLSDLHRRLLGARSAHAWAAESRTAADLLYLCLTTLLGNRTLGEEYCGLVQVEAGSKGGAAAAAVGGSLPALPRRAAYIAGSILLPYGLARVLPSIRARIRARLQRNLALASSSSSSSSSNDPKSASRSPPSPRGWSYKLQAYALANLGTLTSPAPVHALSLALFYFSGSYYELAKRLAGLRYIFTHKVGESSDRAGYELLGVLLVAQMAVQAYLHVRSNLAALGAGAGDVHSSLSGGGGGGGSNNTNNNSSSSLRVVSLDEHAYTSNNELLINSSSSPSLSPPGGSGSSRVDLSALTHTPLPVAAVKQQTDSGGGGGEGARYDLADDGLMRWIKSSQQRKCTLCLEELRDPAATQCGHVFCWSCIGDWVREKPECPLCRRSALAQHILPLRGAA